MLDYFFNIWPRAAIKIWYCLEWYERDNDTPILGNGCGSISRAVASDTRGPRFKSSHRQTLYWILFTVNCTENTKIKKKRPEMAHFLKNIIPQFVITHIIFILFKGCLKTPAYERTLMIWNEITLFISLSQFFLNILFLSNWNWIQLLHDRTNPILVA